MRDAGALRDASQLVQLRGIADEDARFSVAQKILDLGGRIGGVERQEDGAGANAGEIEKDRPGRLFNLDGDAVSGFDAELLQRMCELARPRGKIRECDHSAVMVLDEGLGGLA